MKLNKELIRLIADVLLTCIIAFFALSLYFNITETNNLAKEYYNTQIELNKYQIDMIKADIPQGSVEVTDVQAEEVKEDRVETSLLNCEASKEYLICQLKK